MNCSDFGEALVQTQLESWLCLSALLVGSSSSCTWSTKLLRWSRWRRSVCGSSSSWCQQLIKHWSVSWRPVTRARNRSELSTRC